MGAANAVASGTYSDLRIVKGRKVAVVCIEIPLEKAEHFVSMFGMPCPGEETWVAIARLATDPNAAAVEPIAATPEPAPSEVAEIIPPHRKGALRRAGMLPNDLAFQRWIQGYPPGRRCPVDDWEPADRKLHAEVALRQRLGVKSRSELAGSDDLCAEFDRLVAGYDVACGRRAA